MCIIMYLKKNIKKYYGNMLKTAMSHLAPVPNWPGLKGVFCGFFNISDTSMDFPAIDV
jgi:hypothetical protein